MTDHLADARACIQSAAQAPHTGCTLSWLTATCEQIIAHLEAQQTSQQPVTAPPAAPQPEPGHRDGGEAVQAAMAVLCDEGADSEGGWHSWRCFDRDRYPEPCDCTEQVARAAIAAAEPHIRAEIADEIEQHYLGADFGRNPTTGADSPDASLHDAYDEALNLAARIARQEQP